MSELILPEGVETSREFPPALPEGKGVLVNETDVEDGTLLTYFEENASVLGLSPSTTLTTYTTGGSMMTRPKWRPPTTTMEEVVMCRELAERDDDVAATIGMMQALAFGEGMQHSHPDEVTTALFDELSCEARILAKLKEMYREWLIAGQVTTATVFQQTPLSFTPMGADRQRTRTVAVPLVGVIPTEQIRVIGNDLFGTAQLAYKPFSGRQEQWLMEYFSDQTSAARKNQMRQEDPVLTTLLTEQVAWNEMYDGGTAWVYGDLTDPAIGHFVYTMNPTLVQRSTMPKGQWQHPRPAMARNLPLLEAKRLLTLMDYTLLEAGANFLIVAKKGSDQRPALPEEIGNLAGTLARASRSGLIVGDHRLNIEVITPSLDELLSPEKRKLLGRKIASALLRLPDITSADSGATQAVLSDVEILSRVITSDRDDLRLHMERAVYKLAAQRNDNVNGYPHIWFPKIILQGLQFFQDMILGLRDRGDIPRRYAVEAAGFDWEAAVAARKLEKSSGDDKVMTPAAVPFSSPNAGPQDRGGGRPTGASTGQNKPMAPGTGKVTVQRNAGETIKAMWDHDDGPIYRAGVVTYALLEEYGTNIGRISKFERQALERIENGEETIFTEGPIVTVPVNCEYAIEDLKAIRLDDGKSLIVGRRPEDDAVVARALVFRSGTPLDAEEFALRAGYDIAVEGEVVEGTRRELPAPATVAEEHAHSEHTEPITINVEGGKATRKVVERDEHGRITSVREEPA